MREVGEVRMAEGPFWEIADIARRFYIITN